jgi:hypothetical protein
MIEKHLALDIMYVNIKFKTSSLYVLLCHQKLKVFYMVNTELMDWNQRLR